MRIRSAGFQPASRRGEQGWYRGMRGRSPSLHRRDGFFAPHPLPLSIFVERGGATRNVREQRTEEGIPSNGVENHMPRHVEREKIEVEPETRSRMYEAARHLRRDATASERLLWEA